MNNSQGFVVNYILVAHCIAFFSEPIHLWQQIDMHVHNHTVSGMI